MAIKRILLPINEVDDSRQVADLAFGLAAQHEAQVQGIFPQPGFTQEYWADEYGISVGEFEKTRKETRKRELEAAQVAREIFKSHTERHTKVATDSVFTYKEFTASIIDHAFCADVSGLGHTHLQHNSYWHLLARILLSQSTKPILVAPSRPAPKNVGHRIVIAWKQSPEASRAVAAAMPLIEKAKEVVLLTVGKQKGWISPGVMKDYLALHNPTVREETVDPRSERVSEMLIGKTAEIDGSILVMGAFSKKRWREEIFGGVTKDVLQHTDVPVFMMH